MRTKPCPAAVSYGRPPRRRLRAWPCTLRTLAKACRLRRRRTASRRFIRRRRRAPASAARWISASRRITAAASMYRASPGSGARSPWPSSLIMADLTRVLVVDDEQSMRELLAIMLRQVGYDVTVADGGEAAIKALETDAFDLVITDLRMRKADGLTVLRDAKEHSQRTVMLVVTDFVFT